MHLTIDKPLAATTTDGKSNKDDPVYLLMTVNNAVEVYVQCDMTQGRPLIICNMGTGSISLESSSNNTFRGVVYLPNGTYHTNSCNGNVYGSIIAREQVNLQGGAGDYYYDKALETMGVGSAAVTLDDWPED
jgi:hypothetical protein